MSPELSRTKSPGPKGGNREKKKSGGGGGGGGGCCCCCWCLLLSNLHKSPRFAAAGPVQLTRLLESE